MSGLITVSQPDFGPAEIAAVQAVLTSRWVGMGPRTAEFEARLAERLQVRHVVATSSCTAALHLALSGLERDERNEIIVPSLTFAATIQAIVMSGYDPVFAEVNPETMNLNCEDAARLVTAKTRAIVPVHFGGLPCESEILRQLAADAGIDIVSDGAHAFGATFRGAPLAQRETATCYSFSSNKNITCGEGGAVATNSDALAGRLRETRFLGIDQHTWQRRSKEKPWEYTVRGEGFRYHMSDINAAIGLAQLERLEDFRRRRRELAAAYDAQLADLPGILSVERDLDHTIPHLYVARITEGFRDALYSSLSADRIICGVHYIPNHLQPAFKEFTRPMPVTEELVGQVISLPLHTQMSLDQVESIASRVGAFLRGVHGRTCRVGTAVPVEVDQ